MSARAKKSLGQNFLVDHNLQRKIVHALDPAPDDEILEIGPGRGALTRHLVGRCRSLILVELDKDLAGDLRDAYGADASVRVVEGDILRHHPRDLTSNVEGLKVVGNIPYNITSPILFHLLTRPRPASILLMVQKEVGDRITADPGTSSFGALTVGVRSVVSVEPVLRVPASAFRPVPAVDSVVLRFVPTRPHALSLPEEEALRVLTRAAFQQRRKQFRTILRKHKDLNLSPAQVRALGEATGFDLRRRPETFSPQEFIQLSRALQSLS